MKKTFRMFGLALTAVVIALSFSACGDDDDDKPKDPATHDETIVGTWLYTYTDPYDGEVDEDQLVFKADGTYSFTFKETHPATSTTGAYVDTEWEKGTWSTNSAKNRVYLSVTDSDDRSDIGEKYSESYSITPSGDLLFDGDIYTRK